MFFFLAPSKYGEGNREFFLMFLRATRFDPKYAATKIVNHFKYKANLFGIEKVCLFVCLKET